MLVESSSNLTWSDTLVVKNMSDEEKNENEKMLEEEEDNDQLCEKAPDICTIIITIATIFLVIVTLPFSLVCIIKVVQDYEKVVIFRLGHILGGGARGPGIFFVLPCIDIYEIIDMRVQNFSVPPQEMITKDSVTVYVNAIMYYRVSDAIKAVVNVDDYGGAARALAATTLRNVLGTRTLGDILSDRVAIASEIYEQLVLGTSHWGVTVERVEVKDVRVPEQLVTAMAAEAQAARDARGRVVAAEGEHRAARAYHHAAEILASNPIGLQLRYLQTLENIAAEQNSTILFPVPIDVISRMMMDSHQSRAQVQPPVPREG